MASGFFCDTNLLNDRAAAALTVDPVPSVTPPAPVPPPPPPSPPPPATLQIRSATLTASWATSRVRRGLLAVTLAAPRAARVAIALTRTRRGKVVVVRNWTSRLTSAGTVTRRLAFTGAVLPGTYTVRAREIPGNDVATRSATLKPPRRGSRVEGLDRRERRRCSAPDPAGRPARDVRPVPARRQAGKGQEARHRLAPRRLRGHGSCQPPRERACHRTNRVARIGAHRSGTVDGDAPRRRKAGRGGSRAGRGALGNSRDQGVTVIPGRPHGACGPAVVLRSPTRAAPTAPRVSTPSVVRAASG